MRKRFVTLFMAVLFCLSGMVLNDIDVKAQEEVDVAISEVWTEDALVGYSQSQTRGVYLAQGISIINNAGGGKIGCGGVTNASTRCKVSVTAIVERQVNGSWVRVTSWTSTQTNALTASVSKTLSVASGYYYRVRSTHYANTDVSSSHSGALWM